MASISHLIGIKINRWTILEDLGRKRGSVRKVKAMCDCGVTKIVGLLSITRNKTKSCGCLRSEMNTKHGLEKHPLYQVWSGMIHRCYDGKDNHYMQYGGRGVTVCDEWRNDVTVFYNWAISNGYKKGLELDKDKLSDKRLGMVYSPETCCFLTKRENTWYRKTSHVIEYNGIIMCAAQWVEKLGMNYFTFDARLRRGWTMEKIINTPTQVIYSNKKLAS